MSNNTSPPPMEPRRDFFSCRFFGMRREGMLWSLLLPAKKADGTIAPLTLRITQKGNQFPLYFTNAEAFEVYESLIDDRMAERPNPFENVKNIRRPMGGV